VRSCGIHDPDVPDVVAEVIGRAWRQPGRRRRAAALEVVRRRLARQLGLRERDLPTDSVGLRAIGDYERTRRLYAARFGASDGSWRGAFDAHSRRFAEENGVCPRCASPGPFDRDGYRCPCGYAVDE
jgi:hypothetical protein